MPRDKTVTHQKVLAAAREEFMEYGFEKASMRRIGERSGITAAGLYRHCRDKADLFRQLVEPSVEKIDQWLEAHIARNISTMETGEVDIWKDSEIDMMRDLIYPNMEEYRLLLTKSGGTPYAHFLHDLTRLHQQKMMDFLPLMRQQGLAKRDIDDKELHLLMSAYTAAMFEPVIHGYTEEEAYRCLDLVEEFFLPGWKQLLGV